MSTSITFVQYVDELVKGIAEKDGQCYPCGCCFVSCSYTFSGRQVERLKNVQNYSMVSAVVGIIVLISASICLAVVMGKTGRFPSTCKIIYCIGGGLTGVGLLTCLIATKKLNRLNVMLTNEGLGDLLAREQPNTDIRVQQNITLIKTKFGIVS